MSRRRQIVQGNSEPQSVEWSNPQDPTTWDEPEELKHICKHCGKPYKMKMHLVRHEKGCKKKE